MRRTSAARIRMATAAFLVCSIIFSACSAGDSTNEAKPDLDTANRSATNTSAPAALNANANVGTANTSFGDTSFNVLREARARVEDSAGGERYERIDENPFLEAARAPLSTFSIDVDTASYANVRRFINNGQLPPKDAVRIEELINYFEYDYPQPAGDLPFAVSTEVAVCPWNTRHKIVQVGLQGKKIPLDNLPPSNLVFLVDVSGSMSPPDRLPLLKQGLRILVEQLTAKDRVAMVVYAGTSGLVLPSTLADRKSKILDAINNLEAGGSTNGGEGIELAYSVAQSNFIQGGNNRVILATDGDFNLGVTSDAELVRLIENKRRTGVYLSVLGFGTGNLNDSMMEKLANKGNGNYAYIDTLEEARKALGQQAAGTLYTIAKDVKIQVEFNPAKVAGYRLIGYENRVMAARDFNDDRKDAGEIGAGHSVTALYEIVPAGQKIENPGVDELRYGRIEPTDTRFADELLTVKLRYKKPDEHQSRLLTIGLMDNERAIDAASENLRFAAAVAGFGMLLRNSDYKGKINFDLISRMASSALGRDAKSYRSEFVDLVHRARRLDGRSG